jgi:hypothetical protein
MFEIAFSFAWWWLPLFLFVGGFLAAMLIGARAGDWDFYTPALALIVLATCWAAAAGIVFGKLFIA